MKILYIAGWGRSGSTILDNILGQINGFCSVGELRYVWDRNLTHNRVCGCGASFSECSVWRAIFDKAFGVVSAQESIRINAHLSKAISDWRVPSIALGRALKHDPVLSEILPRLDTLYRTIGEVTGSRIIVDSSKIPAYGWLLTLLPSVEVYVAHLVRDPRAVAFSWMRTKFQVDTGTHMLRRGAFESAWRWSIRNLEVDMMWRDKSEKVRRIKYEHLIADPEGVIRNLIAFVGEQVDRLPITNNNTVHLAPNHTSSGNPNRFATGTLSLRLDDEWQRGMKPIQKSIVSCLTWPLRVRYGY